MPDSAIAKRATESGYHVPEPLKEREVWVVWVPAWDKTARAPWQEGHMYPCEWAAAKSVDPRRDYETARMVADLSVDQIHQSWPFPDDRDLPPNVEPAVLLPNEWDCADPIAFVDFDDVRDPDSGAVPREVWDIIGRLGGFVEISRSGNGLHVWVRGQLPDGKGKFIADLDSRGQIEIYDHGRMTGGTWRHVEGTPRDSIPDADGVIDDLVNEYGSQEDAEDIAMAPVPSRTEERSADGQDPSSSRRSAYYDIDLKRIADTGPFNRYRTDGRNPAADDWQGPHPGHGGTSTADAKSANFNVDGDKWYCFAHDIGGGPLQLLAVVEDVCQCSNSDVIYRDDEKLLKTCLYAREQFPELDDEMPPYAALRAAADLAGLDLVDASEGILGKDTHRLARKVFDNLTPGRV